MRSSAVSVAASAMVVAVVLTACGAADEAGPPDYCAEIRNAMSILDDGGSVAEYDAALARVADASPADHRKAWDLMLTLSREPFDYENFNPAVDALDDISADLDSTCPATERMIVDDDGRIRDLTATG